MFCTDRIIGEYENFQEKALKVPDDSKEMMDQIDYVQEAQTTLVNGLKLSVEVLTIIVMTITLAYLYLLGIDCVQDSLKRLSYLLTVYTFPEEDREMNKTALTWPAKVPSIFEENEKVGIKMTQTITRGQQ